MKKRFLAVLLMVCIVLTLLPVNALAASSLVGGNCGKDGLDNLTWTLDIEGVRDGEGMLTISGTGAMDDYIYYSTDYSTSPSDLVLSSSPPWEAWRDSIKTVIIQSGVTNIGAGAFFDCTNLTNVTISNSVTNIGEDAFYNCGMLTSVTIPNSVISIECQAFYNCTGLTRVTIPYGVTSIGENAFYNCGMLTNVTIPNSVISIAPRAFYNCTSLTNITIPGSLVSIDNQAFYGCTNLTNVTIEDAVDTIWTGAFSNCTSLTSVTIPSSVTLIGEQAFNNCIHLTDVYYDGTEAQWNAINIGSDNFFLTSATIHYNSTGPDDVGLDDPASTPVDSITTIEFLSGWNAESRNVTFGNSGLISPDNYVVADTVDVSNIYQLLNKYVLVTVERSNTVTFNHTVIDIQPLESAIGTVSATGEHSLTIDGMVYPVREDYVLGTYDGQEILYHTSNGIIIDFSVLEEKTGKLEEWNSTNNQLKVNGQIYHTNYLTDLSFLANWAQMYDYTVRLLTVEEDTGYMVVFRVTSLPTTYTETKQFKNYDVIANTVYFTDGTSYLVDEAAELNVNGLANRWVTCTVCNTPGIGTRLVAMEKLATTVTVQITMNAADILYSDGKLCFAGGSYQSKSDFEIPFQIKVTNQVFASVPSEYLRTDDSLNVDITDVTVSAPDGFNFGWVGDGKLDFSGPVTLHAGESWTGNGFIRAGTFYKPAAVINGYNLFAYVDTSIGMISGLGTYTVKDMSKSGSQISGDVEDSTEVKNLAKKANEELKKAKIPFALYSNKMNSLFGISNNTLTRFQQEMFTVIVMSEIPEETLQEKIDKKVLTKLFGKWQPDVSAKQWTLPLTYEIETKEYGRVTVEFSCDILSVIYMGTEFGRYVDVYYEITSSEKAVPQNLKSGQIGGGVNADVEAFATAAYNLVEGELKSAYDIAWGTSANEVADWLFSDTVKKILEAGNTTFKDEVWKLCTWHTTDIINKCPTNVYIYNKAGELCGAIENNMVTKSSDDFSLAVDGSTKYITDLDCEYTVKYVATDHGKMDVEVIEYLGYETPLRRIEYCDVPLQAGGYYTQTISGNIQPSIEEYQLISDTGTIISANDEKVLITLIPAEDEETGTSSDPNFTDISESSWYHDAVQYVYENGLMNGTSATTFEPETTTSRAMIVTILYRLEGEPATDALAFIDVASGQWYSGAVAWAAANDIVDGYGDGNFGPNDPITREQMAAILYRYAQCKGYDVSARADLSGYSDASQVSGYAVDAMRWANAEGLITGTDANLLAPTGTAIRCQAATILMRFCENIVK